MRVGSRWKSAADTTEVLVIRCPSKGVDLRCGGHPMVPAADAAGGVAPLDPAFAAGSLMGKRYVDEDLGLEVLCSKPGQGSLAVGDQVMTQKDAAALPTSD